VRFLKATGIWCGIALATAAVTLTALVWGPGLLGAPAAAATAVIIWPDAQAERTIPEPPPRVERFSVLAVGDLMVHMPQTSAAKTASGYDFWPCFEPVASRIASADVAIGNLETTLAGADKGYTGYPTFNSPDAYAEALKKAGFDILTTANNHTLDKGPSGNARTLDVLDSLGILHTGTARSADERAKVLMTEVRGVKIAVIAYTYGMNGFTAPSGKPWMVNVISEKQMKADVAKARAAEADLVIVSIHNGVEYEREPSASQTKLERALVDVGADVILGSHPHVIQPMEVVTAKRSDETTRPAFIIHSLGNFVSGQRPRYRDTGLMLELVFEKNLKTKATSLVSVEYVPTWVDTNDASGSKYRVLPIGDALGGDYPGVASADLAKMKQAFSDTTSHLGGTGAASSDKAAVVFWGTPIAR
jgi:poly-gamma-glutamate synthesis protein (capsule biosynthesis protein)